MIFSYEESATGGKAHGMMAIKLKAGLLKDAQSKIGGVSWIPSGIGPANSAGQKGTGVF